MRTKFRFTLYKARDGWRWRLRAANGRIIAEGGEAYREKTKAHVGLVRAALAGAELLAGKGVAVVVDEKPPRPRNKPRR